MEGPIISVIVPVYNAEQYIEKCLNSIKNQTFTQIEVLIVDDGSTDRSGFICDQYAEKDSRFRVWHTPNKGSFAARNLALSYAKAPYLGFVDADDWLELDMYLILYKTLVSSTADFVQCGIVNEGKRIQVKNKIAIGQQFVFEENEIYEGLYNEIISHSVNDKLFRTALFEGVFFSEKYYHSDAMAMMKLPQFCKKVICIGETLYHYRTDNQGITRGEKNKKHLLSMEVLFSIYEKMAYKAPGIADFFICKEIPSMGRLIMPNHDITVQECLSHTWYMYKLFCRHWDEAKIYSQFLEAPMAKQLYWRLYHKAPHLGLLIIYLRQKNMIWRIHTIKQNDKM